MPTVFAWELRLAWSKTRLQLMESLGPIPRAANGITWSRGVTYYEVEYWQSSGASLGWLPGLYRG